MNPVTHHQGLPKSLLRQTISSMLIAAVAAWGVTGSKVTAADEMASGLPPMLNLPATGQDPTQIDYLKLPVLKGQHALVTQGEAPWLFRLHSYLAYFEGRYWCMWSQGPKIEDHPTQHVRCATSEDGLKWSESREVMGPSPQEGFRYISRGLWIRDGKLLALASHDEAYNEKGKVHFFGKSLQLLAFEWQPESASWLKLGVVFDDATSKFFGLRTSRGSYVLVSSANPAKPPSRSSPFHWMRSTVSSKVICRRAENSLV